MRTRAAAASIVFALCFVYRLNTLGGALGGFDNDHFIWISQGRQILFGDAPLRDFVDPGTFLMSYVSAATQLVFGYNLLGEAVVTIAVIAAGTAVTFLLVAELSRSLVVATVLALLHIAIAPRLYNYPKVVVYAIGIWACWHYIRRPTVRWVAAIAAFAAIAFLLRHDHGVYLAVASLGTITAVHGQPGVRVAVRHGALHVALLVIFLAPFAAFVQWSGGLRPYLESALSYRARDTAKTALRWPRLELPWPMMVVGPSRPLAAPRMTVRWTTSISDDVRRTREAVHHLANPDFGGGTSWTYDLPAGPTGGAALLLRDAYVANKRGVIVQAIRLELGAPGRWFARARSEVPALRLQASPALLTTENGSAWLYYTVTALPFLVAALLMLPRWVAGMPATRPGEVVRLVPVLMLAIVTNAGFLRGNLASRLPDVSVPSVLLGAWLIAYVGGILNSPALPAEANRRWRQVVPWAVGAAGLATAAATFASVLAIGDFRHELTASGLQSGVGGAGARSARVLRTLRLTPIELWKTGEASVVAPLARYLNRCTAPEDRIFIAAYMPEVFFFADRRFAGGRVQIMPGYYTTEREQRETIARLNSASVPIAITPSGQEYDEDFRPDFPLVDRYLSEHFDRPARLDLGNGRVLRVLFTRGRAPTGTHASLGLPCFG